MSIGGRIALPGPLRPYPLPPDVGGLEPGATPIRVVIGTGGNPRVVWRGRRKVVGLLIQTDAAAAVAYLVDTVTDGDPDATAKRKMPASAPANDMGGWVVPREVGAVMEQGVAVFISTVTAEAFVLLI